MESPCNSIEECNLNSVSYEVEPKYVYPVQVRDTLIE